MRFVEAAFLCVALTAMVGAVNVVLSVARGSASNLFWGLLCLALTGNAIYAFYLDVSGDDSWPC